MATGSLARSWGSAVIGLMWKTPVCARRIAMFSMFKSIGMAIGADTNAGGRSLLILTFESVTSTMKGIGGTRISSSRQSAKLPKVLTNKVPLIPLALTCIKPRSPAVGSSLSADGPNSARMRTIGVASDGEESELCLSDFLDDFWLRNLSKETTPSSSSFISGHIILMTLSYPWKCSPTSTSSPWMERMDTIFGLFLLESLEALPSR